MEFDGICLGLFEISFWSTVKKLENNRSTFAKSYLQKSRGPYCMGHRVYIRVVQNISCNLSALCLRCEMNKNEHFQQYLEVAQST